MVVARGYLLSRCRQSLTPPARDSPAHSVHSRTAVSTRRSFFPSQCRARVSHGSTSTPSIARCSACEQRSLAALRLTATTWAVDTPQRALAAGSQVGPGRTVPDRTAPSRSLPGATPSGDGPPCPERVPEFQVIVRPRLALSPRSAGPSDAPGPAGCSTCTPRRLRSPLTRAWCADKSSRWHSTTVLRHRSFQRLDGRLSALSGVVEAPLFSRTASASSPMRPGSSTRRLPSSGSPRRARARRAAFQLQSAAALQTRGTSPARRTTRSVIPASRAWALHTHRRRLTARGPLSTEQVVTQIGKASDALQRTRLRTPSQFTIPRVCACPCRVSARLLTC